MKNMPMEEAVKVNEALDLIYTFGLSPRVIEGRLAEYTELQKAVSLIRDYQKEYPEIRIPTE